MSTFVLAPLVLISVAVAVGATIVAVLVRRLRDRREHPQDFAFATCTAFGPELGQSRAERILRALPEVPEATLAGWLADFESLDAEIWALARAGGPVVLGEDAVRRTLTGKFPFLCGPGLKQAIFLVGYNAWHEGYDVSPEGDGERK